MELADDDLHAAKSLLRENAPRSSVICFLSQQAAEKSLKAFLSFRGIKFQRTHNLVALLLVCEKDVPDFRSLRAEAELLNPYGLKVRYADDYIPVDANDARMAVEKAGAIVGFVKKDLKATG